MPGRLHMGYLKLNELRTFLFDLEIVLTENESFLPHQEKIQTVLSTAKVSEFGLAQLTLKLIQIYAPNTMKEEVIKLNQRFDSIYEYFGQKRSQLLEP